MAESSAVRVVGLAGSARAESLNRRLLVAALEACASHGLETTLVDLGDYPLPIYNGDLEAREGLPESAQRLRDLLLEHHGMIVASPEYNGSISALLKNTLDWVSRSPDASPDLGPYRGKFAAILAASPGPLGGLRGLRVVREVLTNLGVNVLANQIALGKAFGEFNEDGSLAKEARSQQVDAVARELAEVLRARMRGSRA